MSFDKPAAPAFLPRFYGQLYSPVFGTLYQGPEGGERARSQTRSLPQQLLQQKLPHLEIKTACVPSSRGSCVPVSPTPNIQIWGRQDILHCGRKQTDPGPPGNLH